MWHIYSDFSCCSGSTFQSPHRIKFITTIDIKSRVIFAMFVLALQFLNSIRTETSDNNLEEYKIILSSFSLQNKLHSKPLIFLPSFPECPRQFEIWSTSCKMPYFTQLYFVREEQELYALFYFLLIPPFVFFGRRLFTVVRAWHLEKNVELCVRRN